MNIYFLFQQFLQSSISKCCSWVASPIGLEFFRFHLDCKSIPGCVNYFGNCHPAHCRWHLRDEGWTLARNVSFLMIIYLSIMFKGTSMFCASRDKLFYTVIINFLLVNIYLKQTYLLCIPNSCTSCTTWKVNKETNTDSTKTTTKYENYN